MKCPNCQAPIERIDAFCWSCGQKNRSSRIKLWDFLVEAVENILNMDAKVFKTIRHLPVPGKLTRQFFVDKRASYVSPLRLFFFSAIVHFALLGYMGNKEVEPQVANVEQDALGRFAYYNEVVGDLDSIYPEIIANASDSATYRQAFKTLDTVLMNRVDSLELGYLFLNDEAEWNAQTFKVAYNDIINRNYKKVLERNQVKHWLQRFQVMQEMKLISNPKEVFSLIFRNLIWMAAAIVLVMTLFLKLLYVRRNKFMVEHLVFVFHFQAFAFWLITIVSAILYFNEIENQTAIFLSFIAILVYLYMAMYRVYQQSVFKTIVKYFLFCMAYLTFFGVFAFLTILVSAATL